MRRTASHKQWAEYRARVGELIAAGQSEGTARLVASEEKAARKAARAAEIEAEKAAHAKRALTCQICGRPILADTGRIAHHGYQRPGEGWQTPSCYGALQLPYENDSTILARYVPTLLERAESHAARVVELAAESGPLAYEYHERDRARGRSIDKHVMVTRATFQAVVEALPFEAWQQRCPRPTFESTLLGAIREQESFERLFREEYKRQLARLNAWKLTRVWESDQWKPYTGEKA